MAKIGVIGAGSWGTALGLLCHRNGHDVVIWSHRREEAELLNKKHLNETKLPGIPIPEDILFTGELSEAMKDKEVLVLAVPSASVRNNAQTMKKYCCPGQIIVNVAKGIEENSMKTLSEILEEELPLAEVAVMSGPSHAEEVAQGLPTNIVVSARKQSVAVFLQEIFMNSSFRVYTNPDILGVELGGSLKNVIALAAGIADGLGYGDNTKAALITRGIAEITRLGIAMGASLETFGGLTGIGDLIVTCASVHSRNRKAGYLIGKGCTMEEAMKEVKMVVEGVFSAKAALQLAQKYQVDMPIVEQINQVLFEKKSAKEAVKELMNRDKKTENSSLTWKK